MLAQAATQPCQTAWTPGEVAMLMSVFSSVVIAGIAGAIVKVIEAAKNARLAVLDATAARTATEHNTNRLDGLQQQVTQVALNTPPAPRSPVVPVTFTDAQIRAAGEPDCPEVPAPPTPPAKEG